MKRSFIEKLITFPYKISLFSREYDDIVSIRYFSVVCYALGFWMEIWDNKGNKTFLEYGCCETCYCGVVADGSGGISGHSRVLLSSLMELALPGF